MFFQSIYIQISSICKSVQNIRWDFNWFGWNNNLTKTEQELKHGIQWRNISRHKLSLLSVATHIRAQLKDQISFIVANFGIFNAELLEIMLKLKTHVSRYCKIVNC